MPPPLEQDSDAGRENSRLSEVGVATAYVVLPINAFLREARKWTALGAADHTEILYVTGQADLIVQKRISDLKDAVGLRPENSSALVLNWVFSAPYAEHAYTPVNAGSDTLRFIIHLRIKRGTYSLTTVQMERLLLQYLAERLHTYGCTAGIEVGLGWADLIINGHFDASRVTDFLKLLLDIHTTNVDDGEERVAVFERMLTVIGYRWSEDAPRPSNLSSVVTPLVFVRSETGHVPSFLQSTTTMSTLGSNVSVQMVDGKFDFVVKVEDVAPNFLDGHAMLGDIDDQDGQTQPKPNASIRRVETHLICSEPPPQNDVSASTLRGAGIRSVPRCNCERPMKIRPHQQVSPDLAESVTNVQFLLYSALRDRTSCCDVAAAVGSAQAGLGRLNTQLDRLYQEMETLSKHGTSPAAVTTKYRQIHHKFYQVELWYLFTERILRQRTIGSFEELLGQTDRALAYRGSVQKFLYLADHLMNDFSERVFGNPEPVFAAMYDAVTRIISLPATGLVRIPARHLFALPSVIPDLWHEVGVYRFFRKVRARDIRLALDKNEDEQRYREIGDHFGDLVVYLHGFHGNVFRTMVSLTRAWIDSVSHDGKLPALVRNEMFEDHLARICLLGEFDERRERIHVHGSVPPPFATVDARVMIHEMHALMSPCFGESIPELTPEIVTAAAAKATGKTQQCAHDLWARLHKIIKVPELMVERDGKWLNTYRGELIDYDKFADFNMIFGDLYWWIETRKLAKQEVTYLQKMMGLTRSATLEYHRRQVTRQSS